MFHCFRELKSEHENLIDSFREVKSEMKMLRDREVKFQENSREISLLVLDLQAFSFHFSLLEKSESDFHFTFHFSKRVNLIFISIFTSRKE